MKSASASGRPAVRHSAARRPPRSNGANRPNRRRPAARRR
ncbi:hypothetical protein M218_22370 [Burkholderia pseudomallei MSHR338]|nr:hypothetical protein M218_22370 [Burkholderia pseudomallei MSHR338]